ncbi:hypothetical protein [Caenispirillum bisanense]|uniref:Uncharacterized protein n=1 Tax=Caenispirillum bisanense TaxID=414052 RepID=A0A286GWM8_9PROT|nr:hypothetical protein [Caenispirillum bisanense]SOD99945.1 hypothetical protein SAMN05421508_110131 [Caenispirillum bisanense]
MDELRLTGALPNLDVEIVSRRPAGGGSETVTVTLTATPTLGAAAGALLANPAALMAVMGSPVAGNPMALWMGMMEAAWRPWLGLMQANPFLAYMGGTRRG